VPSRQSPGEQGPARSARCLLGPRLARILRVINLDNSRPLCTSARRTQPTIIIQCTYQHDEQFFGLDPDPRSRLLKQARTQHYSQILPSLLLFSLTNSHLQIPTAIAVVHQVIKHRRGTTGEKVVTGPVERGTVSYELRARSPLVESVNQNFLPGVASFCFNSIKAGA